METRKEYNPHWPFPQYDEQGRHMLQEWADMIDAWVAGESHTPTLLPPSMKVVTTAAPV